MEHYKIKTKISENTVPQQMLPVIETMDRKEYEVLNNPILKYGFVETPFGKSLLATMNGKLAFWGFGAEEQFLLDDLSLRFPTSKQVKDDTELQNIGQAIISQPQRINQVPLFFLGTSFQVKVWKALLTIPFGSVVTYKRVADKIDAPKAARAVGTAIGANPISFLVPCHRVVRADGIIGNYYWGTDKKMMMLGWESNNA